jgi:hypothetical protein
MPEKERGTEIRERGGERKKENRSEYPDLEGVASPSPSSHGGAGLDSFHHYTEPSAKNLRSIGL